MPIRTDLAIENPAIKNLIPGVKQIKRKGIECNITEIIVENDEAARILRKSIGKYITIESNSLSSYTDNTEGIINTISEEIAPLLTVSGDVLIIGLGNNEITPDALGPKVISHIFATRHLDDENVSDTEFSFRGISAVSTGVLGQTGIESAEIVKALCDKIKPSCVVAVDALACADVSRLGNTIQISNTGISPGSGVKNARKELSYNTLGIPVIAIGVPTVIDMYTMSEIITGKEAEKNIPNMMVTPKDIDKLIEKTAKLIGFAINKSIIPEFSVSAFLMN